jgi:hypothetical protein
LRALVLHRRIPSDSTARAEKRRGYQAPEAIGHPLRASTRHACNLCARTCDLAAALSPTSDRSNRESRCERCRRRRWLHDLPVIAAVSQRCDPSFGVAAHAGGSPSFGCVQCGNSVCTGEHTSAAVCLESRDADRALGSLSGGHEYCVRMCYPC